MEQGKGMNTTVDLTTVIDIVGEENIDKMSQQMGALIQLFAKNLKINLDEAGMGRQIKTISQLIDLVNKLGASIQRVSDKKGDRFTLSMQDKEGIFHSRTYDFNEAGLYEGKNANVGKTSAFSLNKETASFQKQADIQNLISAYDKLEYSIVTSEKALQSFGESSKVYKVAAESVDYYRTNLETVRKEILSHHGDLLQGKDPKGRISADVFLGDGELGKTDRNLRGKLEFLELEREARREQEETAKTFKLAHEQEKERNAEEKAQKEEQRQLNKEIADENQRMLNEAVAAYNKEKEQLNEYTKELNTLYSEKERLRKLELNESTPQGSIEAQKEYVNALQEHIQPLENIVKKTDAYKESEEQLALSLQKHQSALKTIEAEAEKSKETKRLKEEEETTKKWLKAKKEEAKQIEHLNELKSKGFSPEIIAGQQAIVNEAKNTRRGFEEAAKGTESYNKALEQFNYEQKVNQQRLKETNSEVKKSISFMDRFRHTLEQVVQAGISWRIFSRVNQTARQVFRTVVELDKSLVDLQIVTNSSRDEAEKLLTTYNKMAKELGSTTQEVANSSVEWLNKIGLLYSNI